MPLLTTLGIIGLATAAAGAAGGAIGSSVNAKKAQDERERMYNESMDYLNSMYYRDPLSTTGTRALIKSMDQRLKEQNEALENRAAAGGATIENQLAARDANNKVMDKVYTSLLQGEDARRAAIEQQKLQLAQANSAAAQAGYLQQAQNWQSWGQQMSQAGLSLGTLGEGGLLGTGNTGK